MLDYQIGNDLLQIRRHITTEQARGICHASLARGKCMARPVKQCVRTEGFCKSKARVRSAACISVDFLPPTVWDLFLGSFSVCFFISSLKIKKSRFYRKLHQSSAACRFREKQGPCEDGTIHSRGRIPCGRPHGVRWEVLAPNNGKVDAIAQPDLDELWQVVTLWKAASRRKWWFLLGGSSHES